MSCHDELSKCFTACLGPFRVPWSRVCLVESSGTFRARVYEVDDGPRVAPSISDVDVVRRRTSSSPSYLHRRHLIWVELSDRAALAALRVRCYRECLPMLDVGE